MEYYLPVAQLVCVFARWMNCKTPTQAILVKPQQKSNGFRIPRWKKSSFLVGNVDVTFLVFFEVSRHAVVSTEGNTQLMPKEWVEGTMRYEGGFSFQILHLSKKDVQSYDVGASAESLSCCHQWIVASASQKRLQRSDAVVSHRSGQYIYIRKWLIFLLKMFMLFFFPERFWESSPEKMFCSHQVSPISPILEDPQAEGNPD